MGREGNTMTSIVSGAYQAAHKLLIVSILGIYSAWSCTCLFPGSNNCQVFLLKISNSSGNDEA